jgi:choline transport protein
MMHHLNIGAMIIHGCGFIVVIVVLCVMADHHDASFVFTSFQNESGWSNDGIAWCLGLLTTSYGFVGYDAAAHMSEEMKNAARDMPRAMFGSVVVSGVLTFPYIIALLFSIGDIDELLASPTGSPITQLFVNVTGSNAGGIALNCIITIIATIATTDFLASCSRTTWAFARDNGLPFPKFFARVSPRFNVPVNAILLAAVLQAILSLIFIGNTTAFNAFIALSTVGINLSYCLPVFLYLVYGRWNLKIEKGPFNLGRFGPFVNFVAVCWTAFLTIFLMFPSYQPVTPENMNYAVVILAFVFVFATVLWFAWGRKVFTGPVTEVVGVESFVAEQFEKTEAEDTEAI